MAESAAAGRRAAEARAGEARAGYLPKVQWMENWQGSNNPVFVFSSLLTQRRLAASNFAIDALNNPSPYSNFQTQLMAEQVLYDGRQTKAATQGASIGIEMAKEEERRTRINLVAGTARAYYGVLLAEQMRLVAVETLKSAEADLQRAQASRDAGMITDADVLSIQVHQAAMREQQIRRDAELRVARAALNQAMGADLSSDFQLTTTLAEFTGAPAIADSRRPEIRQAQLAGEFAGTRISAAKAGYLPRVSLRAMWEADRRYVVTQGGANWFLGGSLQWTLFDGHATRSRVAQATEEQLRAKAMEREAASQANLAVRQAAAHLESAAERLKVAAASVSAGEESLRIIRNRYEGGLTTVTELLRAEVALLEARSRRVAALHDQRLAALELEFAKGTLAPESEVLAQ